MDSDLNMKTEHAPSVSDGLMSDHPYFTLACVLNEAFLQASTGKGADRHGKGQRFEDQRMQSISQLLGSERGMAYQVCKKVAEGLDLPTTDRKVAELLGAINYLAGIVIYLRDIDADFRRPPGGAQADFERVKARLQRVSDMRGADRVARVLGRWNVRQYDLCLVPELWEHIVMECDAILGTDAHPGDE